MKCLVCDFNDDKNIQPDSKEKFIELTGIETPPFSFIGTELGNAKIKGTPVQAFACPKCGIVRIRK